MNRVYIAAGSNKGDRTGSVIKTLKRLEKHVFITKISTFIQTPPAEGAAGGFFINGVIEGMTGLAPVKLFEFLQDTEKDIGRKHPHKKGDEREIDLDIIFYGSRIVKTQKLTVPHPRYRKRSFVMKPLYDIAPDFVDPETERTVGSMYREFTKNEGCYKSIRNA